MPSPNISVIPANAGIQYVGLISLRNNQRNNLDSGVRRNDGCFSSHFGNFHRL
jgi:hypothetical protein